VEPDGHVNADGILYREPRRPFTGTLWDALRNAFIRIGVGNRRLPTGGRHQGYIWVPSINGFRRTLAQTLLDEQRLAEQLRNAQQPRRSGQAQELFGPDVPNATLLEISWYVSACGHHVPWGWFNLVANAFKAAVDKTGDRGQLLMAYERGERKELGHLQGIARLLTHESFKDKLRRWLRAALLLSTGMYRAKIGLVFFTGQEWEHMGGYVQKDSGKAHYRFYAYPDMSECTFVVFSRLLTVFNRLFANACAWHRARLR
jgi:hypothetical protein